jgi:hypothetical protein
MKPNAMINNQQLAKMIVSSGMPARTLENPYFIDFRKILNPKYDVTGRTRLNRWLKNDYEDSKS